MKHKEKKKHLERPRNVQQDAPQPLRFLEAPGCSQAAGENASSSEHFTSVSSISKLPHHDEEGFHQLHQKVPYLGELNKPVSRLSRKRKIKAWLKGGPYHKQQDAPQPQTFMEAPGPSHAAGENESSSEYYTYVSSLSKLPHHDEDGFRQLQQKVRYLGKLNKPVSRSTRKWKIMEWLKGGPRNVQQDAPQPQTFMEAPGHSQMAGENESSSEYFTCVSSISKLPHHDEDGFHQLQQNVSYLGELNMPVSQSAWKWNIMEWLKGGPRNVQKDAPQPQTFMEAPGHSQVAGENQSSSEYFTYVSSLSKLPHHDEEGFHQLQRNVPYLGELNMPVSQSSRKRKIMEGDLGGPYHIQQEAPQPQTFMEATGSSQAGEENASSSEYFTCVSSLSKLPDHDEEGFHQLQQNVSYLGELNKPVSRLSRKQNIMEWLQGAQTQGLKAWKTSSSDNLSSISSKDRLTGAGSYKIHQDAPQPQTFMEASDHSQVAGEKTSFSEYFTCISSLSKLPHHDEDEFHQLQQNVPYLGELTMSVSQSSQKRKIMEWLQGGPCNIQQDTPRPESRVEAPGCSQAAGESTTSSEYFTCVSSPSKLPGPKNDGIKERTVPKDLVQTKSSSDYSYTSSSSHSASNKEPRLMKIYYMRVQMKRGVAALCHTEEGWEPPSKKIKMEEMTYTTEVHKNVPLSHTSGKNPLIDPEPSTSSPAPEKREKAGCLPEPPTLVVYRRILLRKPLDSGFRCLACCHVFPSLEVLQQHVEHGVSEGFSCHVFHRAMARLKYKKLKRKNKKFMKATLSC